MLPEIKLECRTGHRFVTRAKAGQSIPCQVCGVSVWISKYARGPWLHLGDRNARAS